MTTQGNTGFTGSLTSACRGKLSSGMRTPAIAMTRLVDPAATTPTRRARTGPRSVSTPLTAPSAPQVMPVTAQSWTISTPSAEAARA